MRGAAECAAAGKLPAATIAPMSHNPDPTLHVIVPTALATAATDAARQGQRFPALETLLAGATIARRPQSLEQAVATPLGIGQPPVPIAALRLAAADEREQVA